MSVNNKIITLLTDFGTSDGYIGAMKGVILSINPNAIVVDISHEIQPQNIQQAAYVLDTVHPYYPESTIHVVVVDPGVGTERQAVILKTPRAFFIAPDNGVLSPVAEDRVETIAITNPDYWLSQVSTTFHGRDIFAPVAAHLSLGISPDRFGEIISSLVTLANPQPEIEPNGTVIGQVIHIDHFGNLITNIKGDDLPQTDFFVEIKSLVIHRLSSSYAEGDGLLALVGSNGYLEIGVKNGNAAACLGAECGERVDIIANSKHRHTLT